MSDKKNRKGRMAVFFDGGLLDSLCRKGLPPQITGAGENRPAQGTDGESGVRSPGPQQGQRGPHPVSDHLVAEIATCLWYLKTKHFKRAWDDPETGDDDPRVRKALGRINRGIDALRKDRIQVHDPTGRRYPQGGEALMRPIQFLPTPGVACETVSETVLPAVFSNDRLVQRGEVFVAVPRNEPGEGGLAETEQEGCADEDAGAVQTYGPPAPKK